MYDNTMVQNPRFEARPNLAHRLMTSYEGRVPNFQRLIWSVDLYTKETLRPSSGTAGIGGQNDGLGSTGVGTKVRFHPKFNVFENH